MQLSVIIVNYNVKFFLEQCLHSLILATENITTEIFVIDNNSSDGSQAYLGNRFPSVHFTWLNKNIGFGKASNSALPDATGDYILFLNPDTLLAEDSLQKALAFAQQQKKAGAIGVRMMDGAGDFLPESKRMYPTPSAAFFKLTGLQSLFSKNRFFSKYYAGQLGEEVTGEVDILPGAFMLLSRNAITITRGFDENFFMYGEDIDISYRLLQAGFTNYYLGDVNIIHFKGESTQKKNYSYHKNFYGAMRLFVNKHEQGVIKLFSQVGILLGH
ncbi:MAG: glycosyltransferase family 2 protein, partial [Ferruginibacter sp.]